MILDDEPPPLISVNFMDENDEKKDNDKTEIPKESDETKATAIQENAKEEIKVEEIVENKEEIKENEETKIEEENITQAIEENLEENPEEAKEYNKENMQIVMYKENDEILHLGNKQSTAPLTKPLNFCTNFPQKEEKFTIESLIDNFCSVEQLTSVCLL